MTEDGRMITALIPNGMASALAEISKRLDRSKSWIVREALGDWLAEQQRRHEFTLEALKDVDEGRMTSHADVQLWATRRKSDRRPSAG